jgi:hypothetical protein
MLIESNLRVEKAGLDYLLASPINKIFTSIAQVCGSDKIADWTNEAVRYRLLKTTQMGAELCVKSIGNYYLEFKTDYQANSLKPSISKFKSFITKYYKQSQGLSDLTVLFGEENTFIHGQIKATTTQNTQFTTSFSSGQFRGLGVIDNYKRSVGSRQPASIVNE